MSGSRREPVDSGTDPQVESGNVRIVREGYALWNEHRFGEAIERFWHPDAVLHHLPGWPEPGPSVGRDAVAAQFARIRQDFDLDRLEILDLREFEHAVVVRARWFVRGIGSGAETSTDLSPVYWFENGLVVRAAIFRDHDEALEAAYASP